MPRCNGALLHTLSCFIKRCCLFGIVMVGALGCASISDIGKSTQRIARNLTSMGDDLKKKTGIAFIWNRSFYRDQKLESFFEQALVKTLRQECSQMLLFEPQDPAMVPVVASLPRAEGRAIDKLALAQAGRQHGLNSVLTGAIEVIRGKKKTKGILWYKDTYYYLQLQIIVAAYDTETGAKLLDRSYTREIEVDQYEYEAVMAQKQIRMDDIMSSTEDIAEEAALDVCDVVVSQPWKGYIVAMRDDRVIISSGQASGIEEGDQFEVFDSGRIIRGSGGQAFFLPGLKTGEIKITAVYDQTAEGMLTSGDRAAVGSSVKP